MKGIRPDFKMRRGRERESYTEQPASIYGHQTRETPLRLDCVGIPSPSNLSKSIGRVVNEEWVTIVPKSENMVKRFALVQHVVIT